MPQTAPDLHKFTMMIPPTDAIFMTPSLLRPAPVPVCKVVETPSDTVTLMQTQALDMPKPCSWGPPTP